VGIIVNNVDQCIKAKSIELSTKGRITSKKRVTTRNKSNKQKESHNKKQELQAAKRHSINTHKRISREKSNKGPPAKAAGPAT
jgi:hypothetical protein